MKWEYLTLFLDIDNSRPSDISTKLDLHGEDGWELIQVIEARNEETLLFPSDKIVHVDDLSKEARNLDDACRAWLEAKPGNFVYKRVFTPAQAVAEEEVPF